MMLSKVSNFVKFTSYAMIVAMDVDGGIGYNNDLPWSRNKEDMKWFRDNTMSKIIIMGRSTWESIGSKPLDGRINIVISRTLDKQVAQDINVSNKEDTNKGYVIFVKSPAEAREVVDHTSGTLHNGGEVMVIGGAQIYEAFWPHISRVYLTTFEDSYPADVSIDMDLSVFTLVYRDATKVLAPKFEIWDAKNTFSVKRKENTRV